MHRGKFRSKGACAGVEGLQQAGTLQKLLLEGYAHCGLHSCTESPLSPAADMLVHSARARLQVQRVQSTVPQGATQQLYV